MWRSRADNGGGRGDGGVVWGCRVLYGGIGWGISGFQEVRARFWWVTRVGGCLEAVVELSQDG